MKSYPDDIWVHIFAYITNFNTLWTLFATGDRTIANCLSHCHTAKYAFRLAPNAPSLLKILEDISSLQGLKHITVEFIPKTPIGEVNLRLEDSHVQRLPSNLKSLHLNIAGLVIDPTALRSLPSSLESLHAFLGFYSSEQKDSPKFFHYEDIKWPNLLDLVFTGPVWKLDINRLVIDSLPVTLTRLDLLKTINESEDLLGLYKPSFNTFAQLTNLRYLRYIPPEQDPIYFPPNLTELVLEYTSRPNWYFRRVPRCLQSFTASSSKKMTPAHPTCFEKDFFKLPSTLTYFHSHETTQFSNVDLLNKGALPPALTSVNFGKVAYHALVALPSTITELNIVFSKGDHEDIPPVKQLFPVLQKISLRSTVFYQLPSSFFSGLPLNQLTHINLGSQANVPLQFWDEFIEKNACCHRLSFSEKASSNFTQYHFEHLPSTLTSLSACIKSWPLQDASISHLPAGLSSLELHGEEDLTDAAIALLPRRLERFDCSCNYSFTDYSLQHWPISLKYIAIGASAQLSCSELKARLGNKCFLQLLYRTE